MTHIAKSKMDRKGLPLDLNRRNFLIGSSAAGLAFGYVAVTGVHGISEALAAGKFEPTAWYSIAPDGKITVMVGKAEMGQHVSSAMAQIVARAVCLPERLRPSEGYAQGPMGRQDALRCWARALEDKP